VQTEQGGLDSEEKQQQQPGLLLARNNSFNKAIQEGSKIAYVSSLSRHETVWNG
jgi:hypothetical protein